MLAPPRWLDTGVAPRRPLRPVRALSCVAVVILAHAALGLGLMASPQQPAGTRAPAVQVRQLVVPVVASTDATVTPVVAASARPRVPVQAAAAPRRTARAPDRAPEPPASDAAAPAVVAAPATATPLPIYPTRIPPSASLSYTVQRGAVLGEANLHWRVDGERYQLHLQATMAQGRPIDRHSQGGFDEAGLAPLRLADRRGGRDVRAANFQRERGLITFSGPRWQFPLHGGAQDRLSWLVQLVAIASASPDVLHDGASLSMWVAGTRGALGAWRFDVRGREPLAATDGAASVWCLVREPEHPYDVRVEVWLDPARGHWPVRLRQTQVPGGDPLEWTLRDEPRLSIGT